MMLDGPMGTALALAPAAAARAALTHPAEVRAIHAAYVAAGAQALLTHTTALPWAIASGETHSMTQAVAWLDAALACAENLGAEVWIALGPGTVSEGVLTWAAATAREGRARGVWFETWSADDAEKLSAAAAAAKAMRLEYVVTFLPHANPEITRTLLEAERAAVAVGLNCGLPLIGREDALVLAAAKLAPLQKRVFKPAITFGSRSLSVAQAVSLAKAARADWVGLCCGGTAAQLRAFTAWTA